MDNQLIQWIKFIIQIAIIPFVVYTTVSLTNLEKQVAVIQNTMAQRTSYRDAQIADFVSIIKDHEARLRYLENHH